MDSTNGHSSLQTPKSCLAWTVLDQNQAHLEGPIEWGGDRIAIARRPRLRVTTPLANTEIFHF